MTIEHTKRITIDDIKPILKEYNLKLGTGSFCIVNSRCCPLSALAVKFYKTKAIGASMIISHIKEVYGEHYISGYWRGFDHPTCYFTGDFDLDRQKQGHMDGKLLREQLKDITVTIFD